jgi:F-type H+-transporting ATPase subunit a
LYNFEVFHTCLLIFAANFRNGMISARVKCLLVAAFSLFSLSIFNGAFAQEHGHNDTLPGATPGFEVEHSESKFDPAKTIMDHIQDGHEFHFFTVGDFNAVLPLPVILYSPQRGLDVFMSSKFEHGHAAYKGYRIEESKVVPVSEDGHTVDESVKVYDISLSRNVVQMIIALTLLVLLMTNIAKKYKTGQGTTSAPKGWQNAVEPVITFVIDEVAKPNLGRKYKKYLPYLLTVFFFIVINSFVGLIPGSANVTGNIAFTFVLGVISFIVTMLSTNKHFWGHIFWPPVPHAIKVIMIPVEILGIFTKPFALIVRLFANMVAGHIIILSFISLIFIFGTMNTIAGWGFSPFSILFTVFIYLIEILIIFIQAFIFTNLTAIFIGQGFEGGHDDVDHHADAVII